MYYSDKAGAGKTWKIMNDFKEMTKNQDVPIELKSFFLDVNMESLPKLDEHNQTRNYVHFDLSPDLFDNDYRLFDDLWIFLVLRYHINPDGTSTPTPENVFFEVPTLSKEQFPDGDFIKKYDFPIYINKYHQISMNPKEGQEKIGDIELPKKVADLCKEVFNEEIKLTSQLLNVAARLFFNEILNCYTINNNGIESTKTFISEFFKNSNNEESLTNVMNSKKNLSSTRKRSFYCLKYQKIKMRKLIISIVYLKVFSLSFTICSRKILKI